MTNVSQPAGGVKNERLLPCPFCGGSARLVNDVGDISVRCQTCGAHSDDPGTEGQAVALWNRRPPADAGKAPIAWRWKPKDSSSWLLTDNLDWMPEANKPHTDIEALYAPPADAGKARARQEHSEMPPMPEDDTPVRVEFRTAWEIEQERLAEKRRPPAPADAGKADSGEASGDPTLYPCRQTTGQIAADGSCMRCQADQGVACRDRVTAKDAGAKP